MPDLKQALKDFVATSNSGKYSDEATLLSKFPELKGYNINSLKDFVATSNSGKYATEDELFSKFPEFQIQAVEPVKKKEEGQPQKQVASTGLPSAGGQLVSPTKDETPKEKEFFTGKFGLALQTLDLVSGTGIGDFIDDMGRAIFAGNKQGAIVTPSNKLMLSGKSASPESIKKFVEASKAMEGVGPSDEMVGFTKEYEQSGKGIFGVLKGLAKNPGAIPEIMMSSYTAMVNPTSVGAAGAVAGTAAAGGALLTPEFGGIGAVPAAIGSVPYAMAAAGTTLETGLTFSELMQDELKKRGLDFTEENVKTILEDEEALSKIRTKSIARGATIGLIDAMTGRLAGKVGAKLVGNTAAAKVKAGLAAGAIEAVGGSAGEAAGRAVAGQPMDVAEIALEGIAETPSAAVDIVSEVMSKPSFKVNGEAITEKDLDDIIKYSTADELQSMNIEIKNDKKGYNNKIQDIVLTDQIRKEVEQANPDIDEQSLAEIVQLEKELKKFENNKTQSGKDKAADIRSQIKALQENAVQKQSTDEGVLRTEQPEMGLQQMGEGNQKPEVTTQRTKEEIESQRQDALDNIVQFHGADGISFGTYKQGEGGRDLLTETSNISGRTREEAVDLINKFYDDKIAALEQGVSLKTQDEITQALEQLPIEQKMQYIDGVTPINGNERLIAEQYQQAKQDGSNPELVKAVEVLLGVPETVSLKTQELTIDDIRSLNEDQLSEAYAEIPIRLLPTSEEVSIQDAVYDAYSKAKKSGSVPLLVEAVEKLFPKTQAPSIEEQPSEEVQALEKLLGIGPREKTAEEKTLFNNIVKSVKTVFPTLKTQSFATYKEMKDFAEKNFGRNVSQQVFGGVGGIIVLDKNNKPLAILINESSSDATTLPHEVWHGLLMKAFGENQQLFAEFRDSINKALRDNGYNEIADELDQFVDTEEYKQSGSQAEEWLVQFGGILSSLNIDPNKLTNQEKSLLSRIKDIVNEFAKRITGQPVFLENATPKDILDFMVAISDKMTKGEDLSGFFRATEGAEQGRPSQKVKKQIIGQHANLSKTVRNYLEVAKGMEKSGFDPRRIKSSTGWERGVGKRWRYEIADGKLKDIDLDDLPTKIDVNGKEYKYAKLKDIFDAPELYDAYNKALKTVTEEKENITEERRLDIPAIGDIEVRFEDLPRTNMGYAKSDVIGLNKNVYLTNKPEIESTLTHEIQHIIQRIEGFELGSNTRVSKAYVDNFYKALNDRVEQAKKAFELADQFLKDQPHYIDLAKSTLDKVTKDVKEFKKKRMILGGKTPRTTDEQYIKQLKQKDYDYYRRTAGEVEARNAQLRRALSASERRKVLLSETEDVAPEDQFIFWENAEEFKVKPQIKASNMTIEKDGTEMSLTGTEEVVKGSNLPTVKDGDNFYNDYTVDEIMKATHAPSSRVVTLAYTLGTGQITSPKGIVDLPYENKSLSKKIKDLKRRYSEITGSSAQAKSEKEKLKNQINKAAKQILSEFKDVMTQNLLALYDSLTEDFITRSKEWYVGANRMANALANKYNMTTDQVSGIIAVLSPQNDWFNNVSLAERVVDIMTKHGKTKITKDMVDKAVADIIRRDPESNTSKVYEDLYKKLGDVSINELEERSGDTILEQSVVLRILDQTFNNPTVSITDPTGKSIKGNGGAVKWKSFNDISKAILIYRNGSLENINDQLGNGNKVRNFYNNITDPNSATPYVTADTHAMSAAANIPVSAETAGNNFKLFTGSKEPMYALVKQSYIDAANIAGVMPREMQSITWEAQRVGINNNKRTPEQKLDNFEYVKSTRKNNQTPYERATEHITRYRSSDPSWGGPDGIRTQKTNEEIRQGLELRAQQRASEVSALRGLEGGGVRGADTGMGKRAAGREGVSEARVKAQAQRTNKTLTDETKQSVRPERAGDGGGRIEVSSITPLEGAPSVPGVNGPDPQLVAVAEDYAKENGIPFRRQAEYVKVDEARAKRIADAYEAMPNEPQNPKVKEAYDNLIKQTIAQYNALEKAGYRFWFMDLNIPSNAEYASSPYNAIRDLRQNKEMGVFPTTDGYGDGGISELDVDNNPMLMDTGIEWPVGGLDGQMKTVLANDLFRAVHDAFGHGLEGAGFRARGEENAWQAHVRLFTGSAIGAITSETRGQNSWLNYGPHGEKNRNAKVEDTIFAEQKVGLMPEWTWKEGLAGDQVKAQRRPTIESVIKSGRANGFSENAIKQVLARLGYTTEQINAAVTEEKGAAKRVSITDTFAQGYEETMKSIEDYIASITKTGILDAEGITKRAISKLKNTDLYKNATDVQKEKLVREVRSMLGKREKAAPSPEKLFGEIADVNNITMTEAELLKKKIRDMARGAKEAKAAWVKISTELTKYVKSLVGKGSINVKQAATVLRVFSRVNMFSQESIDKFVDYMVKVFKDADYADKISKLNKLLPVARKNAKTKIGIAENLSPMLNRMLSISPNLIPDSVFNKYVGIVSMMGERKTVLALQEINSLTKDVNEILDAVDEEVSMAEELSERFDSYDNKVVEDNKINYAETIKNMLEDGVITEAEAKVMRKYKSKIMPVETKKGMTEQELADEKEELLKALNVYDIDPSTLPTQEERGLASKLKKLIKTNAVKELDNTQLKNLIRLISNINNGYLPHYAELMVERLNAINNSNELTSAVNSAKPLSKTKIYANIKSKFTKKDSLLELIRRNPLYYIDQVFGNFKTKSIFNSVFEPAAQAQSAFTSSLKRVQNKLDIAQENVSKSFKNNPNKTLESKFKMMAYMIQLEFESNPDNKQVNPAAEYLKATIDHIRTGKSNYTDRDADILQDIYDTYVSDGKLDNQKLYSSFNPAEKNALETIRQVNESLRDKAVYTAAIIRGDKITPLNNYVHLNTLNENRPDDSISGITDVSNYSDSMRPSTKAKSLIERTGKVVPLNFDVFASANRGAKFVLMDYHLTEPIRTARKTLNDASKKIKSNEGKKILRAIERAFEESVDNLLTNNFVTTSIADDVVDFISKQGYRAVLASSTRFVAELTSNIGFAVVVDPKSFAEGTKYNNIMLSADGLDVMNNVGSKQTNRLYPSDTLSGKAVDTSILNQASGIKGGRAKSDVANKIQTIYNNSLKKYKNSVDFTADTLISTPDKIVMRPIWFGSFAREFKSITGSDVDFDKIANNEEAYMNKNEEAIKKAKDIADEKSVLAGASDNAFMGILKGTVKPNQSAFIRGFNMFNNFMTRFLIYEYITARTGIYAAMGNGSISRKDGVALLGGVTTRMMLYSVLSTVLAEGLVGLFVPDEDEDDEKSILQKIGQAFVSSVTGLILGRDFGNAVKTPINYGIERINEEYLDFLRKGDYDPYKDAIQYSIIPAETKGKKTDLSTFVMNMAGPFSPAIKTTNLLLKNAFQEPKKEEEAIARTKKEQGVRIPLEVLGNLGMIPLYKDVRKVVNAQIYKDLDKAAKDTKDKKKPSMNKEDMKRYFPDMYEQMYGPNSPSYEVEQMMKGIKKEQEDMERKMKDELYNYTPKSSKGRN